MVLKLEIRSVFGTFLYALSIIESLSTIYKFRFSESNQTP